MEELEDVGKGKIYVGRRVNDFKIEYKLAYGVRRIWVTIY